MNCGWPEGAAGGKDGRTGYKTTLPQKLPSRYRISLHVDDEAVICSMGAQYGFRTYQLDAQDDDWKEKIIARAEEIKKLDHPELLEQ